jgi:5-methyltetrahydrofolate--homocysteine methyltransferase
MIKVRGVFKEVKMDLIKDISESLEIGDAERVTELTKQALGTGVPAAAVLNQGLILGMNRIGEKFKDHEIFLPDVLLAAKAMYAGMDLIKPLLIKENIPTLGKVVIGSIQGDLHDIGKNLVAIMLKGVGFEIIDLGNDVAPEKFVAAAQKENAQVIGMSALLTTTMPGMKKVVDLLKEKGLAGRVKVIVGGAPVTDEYRQEIGADAYGYDAANAVDKVKQLVGA